MAAGVDADSGAETLLVAVGVADSAAVGVAGGGVTVAAASVRPGAGVDDESGFALTVGDGSEATGLGVRVGSSGSGVRVGGGTGETGA
jgi:hypothetical protein